MYSTTEDMYLPNREAAFIPAEKLTGYLLSESHALGRSKARFFRAFGFGEESIGLLEQGLLSIARHTEVDEEKPSAYGTKYVIRGRLETPSGAVVRIETVWIIEAGEDNPRFVTAYPAKR